MAQARRGAARPRRSREDWLDAALDVLSRSGGARIRIRDLCADLGVTTGSFYAHFRDRGDFLLSVAMHWRRRSTTRIVDATRQSSGEPKSRLLALAKGIIEDDLARYDVAVRAWATQESAVASIVEDVDEERLSLLRDLMAELGFRGAEREMRARTFVTYYGLELAVLARQNKRRRLEDARLRVEMLARPPRG